MKLQRNVLRLEPACIDIFNEIAGFAASALDCEVSRAAVMRAALEAWLQASAGLSLEQMIESIRPGIVKRGRRPYKHVPLVIDRHATWIDRIAAKERRAAPQQTGELVVSKQKGRRGS